MGILLGDVFQRKREQVDKKKKNVHIHDSRKSSQKLENRSLHIKRTPLASEQKYSMSNHVIYLDEIYKIKR